MFPLVPMLQQPDRPMPPPPPPPPDGALRHPPFLAMARELGLGEAQIARLKVIHTAHREALETLHTALREAQKAVMDAVQDGADLKAVHAAFAQAHLAAMTEAKAVHSELLAVLTPEQQARAKALHAQHPEGRGPGHGPGRGRPGSGDPALPPPPHPFGEAE